MVTTIDCNYVMPNVAAAYLLHCGDKACFIDNNTSYAVPSMMTALARAGYEPAQVAYIIITHVHLDHAGGTGLLLEQCPNAKVVAHPRAAPHVIDPSRLIKSAQAVYGEENFARLYGSILPVPKEKVLVPGDAETLQVGDTELTFLYTRGHANHHFVILDKKSESVFTGDSFGIAYPMLQGGAYPFLFPSTSPTDFDADEARISYKKILDCGARQAYPTHFGVWKDIPLGYEMLMQYMDHAGAIFRELVTKPQSSAEAEYQSAFDAYKRLFDTELARRGLKLDAGEEKMLGLDIDLNAQGLVFAARRVRQKASRM